MARPLRLGFSGSIYHVFAHDNRREAMARTYRSGAYTIHEIADHFGVHYMTVSRVVRFEEKLECETPGTLRWARTNA